MRRMVALTCLLGVLCTSRLASADPSHAGEAGAARRGPAAVASRLDFYGDPLPAGAISRLGSVKLRHLATCIAFSPDGRVLASGGSGIRFWDVSTGRMLREFPVPAAAMALSPDGTRLAAGDSRGSVRLWDVPNARELFARERVHVTENRPERVLGFAWSPDGRWFASISFGNEVYLWDAEDGSRLRSLTVSDKRRHAYGFALSPDGRLLAASSRNEIQFWDLQAGDGPRIVEPAHPSGVNALVFTPDGTRVISGGFRFAEEQLEGQRYPSQIRVWDPATGAMTAELWNAEREPHADASTPIRSLALSSDGKLLVSAHAHELRFWELPGGKLIDAIRSRHIAGRRTGPQGLALSPDRQLVATANGSHVIRLWETDAGRQRFAAPGAHEDTIRTVAWSSDGATIGTASFEGTVCLWDPATGQLRHEFIFSDDSTNLGALAFSPDGRLVAATGDYRIEGLSNSVGAVKLWDVRSGALVREIRLSGKGTGVAFSPDGRWLAACCVSQGGFFGAPPADWKPVPPSLSVFDLESGNTLFSAEGGGNLDHLEFTSDGKSLLFGPQVGRWGFAEGQPPQTIVPARYPFGTAIAMSPDGGWLALGHPQGRGLELVELSSGTTLWEQAGNATGARGRVFGYNALEFSGDGRLLVARGPGEAGEDVVIEVRTGNIVCRFPSRTSSLSAVGFSPDGRKVVSGRGDGTALVWDLRAAAGRTGREPSTQEEWDDLWDALADADAGRAYDAVWTLSDKGAEAVAFLNQRLRPAAPPGEEHVRKLIARLDDADYEARRDATRELRTVARVIQKQLRQASDDSASAELRKRIEALLATARSPLVSQPDEMRSLRAIEILERIGGPEARRVLQTLSGGAAGAIATEESKAALARWNRS